MVYMSWEILCGWFDDKERGLYKKEGGLYKKEGGLYKKEGGEYDRKDTP